MHRGDGGRFAFDSRRRIAAIGPAESCRTVLAVSPLAFADAQWLDTAPAGDLAAASLNALPYRQ
jgi:hypothetical protein